MTLPNCPLCGGREIFDAPPPFSRQVSCCACGLFVKQREQWRTLAEMAAKARAWDRWKSAVDAGRGTKYSDEYAAIDMDRVLAEERKRGGLT